MLLQNKKGEYIDLNLRTFLPSDAPQVITCIRDAYGDSYVKPQLYREECVIEEFELGELSFSVAEDEKGIIAGITACSLSPHFPGQNEMACQVIRREFSGYGLALPLALHAMHRAEQMTLSSQFARALGCHLISQKTLKGMGFTACGFLLNVFDKTKFLHHFQNGSYAKIPQSVAVKRQGKKSAGAVYIPDEFLAAAQTMYDSLELPWILAAEGTPESEDLWDREEDTVHATLTLWARTCGIGFEQRLVHELNSVKDCPGQTVNLYIDLTHPGSAHAFRTAKNLGFIFTGFLPCSQSGEYMILHHPLSQPVETQDIPLIPEYEPFMELIRRQL